MRGMETTQLIEAPAELEELSDEEHRVRSWRLEQFRKLGFGLVPAAMMAETKVDLWQARRLVAAGCPHETATRILL